MATPTADTLFVREALVIAGSDWYRAATSIDPVEALLVLDEWSFPQDGKSVRLAEETTDETTDETIDEATRSRGSERRWHRVEADSAGWIADPDLADGYAFATIETSADRVMILEGFGYQSVYVNREPRAGNLYGYKDTWASWEPRSDFSAIPVRLEAGQNEFLFVRSRAQRLKARLVAPPAEIHLNTRDVTLPDIIVGEYPDTLGAAVVVVNSTTEWARDLSLEARIIRLDAGFHRSTRILNAIPDIPPLSLRKVAFEFAAPALAAPGEVSLKLRLSRGPRSDASGGVRRILARHKESVALSVKRAGQNHRRTFVSGIDGSVQFFAVNPARSSGTDPARSSGTDSARSSGTNPAPALFLSLHGAGVDALNQTGSYAAKTWGHIVAPTNRRPFGFNWEDWGRLDALEVLDLATRTFGIDPDRVYLTGHSMGGHGVWHLGALYPDRFAALGPSAGWISFWSYRPSGDVEARNDAERLLMRSTLPSRTLELAENYASLGVYVLHGADDDNVSPEQARMMVERLQEIHHDFVYHEEPAAGHWWDRNDEAGVDCVDWAEMFDLFARRVRPRSERVRHIRFRTPSPGVAASNHWLRIEAQIRPLEMSAVDLRMDPESRRVTGTTENVSRISFDVSWFDGDSPVLFELDGERLEASPGGGRATLLRNTTAAQRTGSWEVGNPPPPSRKGPDRYGMFKDVFRNRVLFVYGTAGTSAENAWAFAKARFDAEHFWYQANGSIEVIADVAFEPDAQPDRNVVLYGNASTNRAWDALLGRSPVRVARGKLTVGDAERRDDELGVLLIRPRPGSELASVAAVAGTGVTGMRVLNRLPYLSAGFAFPDLTVFDAGLLRDGSGCLLLAGVFGSDWGLQGGEFAGDEALRP